jgi:hypothetical protein
MRPAVLLVLLLFTPLMGFTQFVQFSLQIEPELSVETQTELDFGQLSFDESVEIGIDDARVGIFNIYGLANALVGMEIESPTYLIHTDYRNCYEEWCRIKVNLNYAYTTQGIFEEGRRNAVVIPEVGNISQIYVPLKPRETAQAGAQYAQLTLFVYGNVVTGEAIPGSYVAEVQLVILYE